MQTIKPASKQIFARPHEATQKTQSGILLAEKMAEKPQMATVINVGDGVTQFQKDDTIVYKLFTTTDIKLNGEEFILIEEEDVLGTVLETK